MCYAEFGEDLDHDQLFRLWEKTIGEADLTDPDRVKYLTNKLSSDLMENKLVIGAFTTLLSWMTNRQREQLQTIAEKQPVEAQTN